MRETIPDKKGSIYTVTGIMEDIPYNLHIQANAIVSIETLRHNGDKSNFQYKVDIGYFLFLKTFMITIVFTLFAVSFLIFKTHRMNLVRTLKRE